jgi:hypothetical protein
VAPHGRFDAAGDLQDEPPSQRLADPREVLARQHRDEDVPGAQLGEAILSIGVIGIS